MFKTLARLFMPKQPTVPAETKPHPLDGPTKKAVLTSASDSLTTSVQPASLPPKQEDQIPLLTETLPPTPSTPSSGGFGSPVGGFASTVPSTFGAPAPAAGGFGAPAGGFGGGFNQPIAMTASGKKIAPTGDEPAL